MAKFSEAMIKNLYDSTDEYCRTFWDEKGGLHWGYFEDCNSDDFSKAVAYWDNYMFTQSGIDDKSKVLELGCGNGVSSFFIAEQAKCNVTGIDISSVRISNAETSAKKKQGVNIVFEEGSILDLPYEDEVFTHTWSQAVIYHAQDVAKVITEAYRVLKKNGVFIFDDLLQPKPNISKDARKYVYARMHFEKAFNHKEYIRALENVGFNVKKTLDLSQHLRKNYALLVDRVKDIDPERSYAYKKMCEAIDNSELGWGFFLCVKETM